MLEKIYYRYNFRNKHGIKLHGMTNVISLKHFSEKNKNEKSKNFYRHLHHHLHHHHQRDDKEEEEEEEEEEKILNQKKEQTRKKETQNDFFIKLN